MMAEKPFESMAEEAGLDADEYAEVTAMLEEVRSAAGDLPGPVPGPELAAMLASPSVRRLARRRRLAALTGGTALVLGSLGGAAAADVLPEPVRGLVVEFPGFPGGPGPVAPVVPSTPPEETPPEVEPATPAATPPGVDFFDLVPEVAPPDDRPSPSSPRGRDEDGEGGQAPASPPDRPSRSGEAGAPDAGSGASGNSERAEDRGNAGGAAGSGDTETPENSEGDAGTQEGSSGPRRRLPAPVEDEQGGSSGAS